MKTVARVIALSGMLALFLPGGLLGQTAPVKPPTSAEITNIKAMGSRQAPVVIEVFSDYQCPQCRVFYLDTARQLMNSYIPSGKVYYVHRDFPLSMHSHSREAARWATAVAIADGGSAFTAVEQALYSKQDDWGSTGKVLEAFAPTLSPTDMKKARQVEATQGALIDATIASDTALAESRHVDGTPTIFVTHAGQTTQLPPGGVNYSLLKQYIDYLLQKH